MKPSELQIQIDDILSCLGSCAGCVLSESERLSEGAAMHPDTMGKAFVKLDEYVRELDDLNSINVTFGVADHLLLPPEYTGRIYRQAAAMITRSRASAGAVFFSTSLVGKQESVKMALNEIRSWSFMREVPLIPVVVVDPDKMSLASYGKIYAANIEYAKALFGRIDLALNLSAKAVEIMTPDDLVSFAESYGYDEVTINWAPTPGNIAKTAMDVEAISSWLLAFAVRAKESEGIRYSYGDVVVRAMDAARQADQEDMPLDEFVPSVVMDTARRSIQVDPSGDITVKIEGIGDIAYNQRFGFQPIGHVDSPDSIDAMLSAAEDEMVSRVIGAHMRSSRCVECPHVRACSMTGFHAYNVILRKAGVQSNGDCPHMAKRLFEFFSA